MRSLLFISIVATCATAVQAQTADGLSRRINPNPIDRALSRTTPSAPDPAAQAAANQERSERAARDAATRRGPLPSSTMIDGPAGVQRAGSGTLPGAAIPPPVPQD